jgi:predicted transcriptional regulator
VNGLLPIVALIAFRNSRIIAEILERSRATVSGTLTHLAAKGLIERDGFVERAKRHRHGADLIRWKRRR